MLYSRIDTPGRPKMTYEPDAMDDGLQRRAWLEPPDARGYLDLRLALGARGSSVARLRDHNKCTDRGQ